MDSAAEIAQMTEKMNKMDEILNKDIFTNPIKEVQRKMQAELLDFKTTFLKNLNDLTVHLGKEGEASDKNANTNLPQSQSEEMIDWQVAWEHKKYQVETLKKSFNDYEQKAESQMREWIAENEKLKEQIKELSKKN